MGRPDKPVNPKIPTPVTTPATTGGTPGGTPATTKVVKGGDKKTKR